MLPWVSHSNELCIQSTMLPVTWSPLTHNMLISLPQQSAPGLFFNSHCKLSDNWVLLSAPTWDVPAESSSTSLGVKETVWTDFTSAPFAPFGLFWFHQFMPRTKDTCPWVNTQCQFESISLPCFKPSVASASKFSLPLLLLPQLVAVLEFCLPHWLNYRIDFCTGKKEFNWWITVTFVPLDSANLQAISVFQKIGPSGRRSIWIWASAIYLPQALRAWWSSVVTWKASWDLIGIMGP